MLRPLGGNGRHISVYQALYRHIKPQSSDVAIAIREMPDCRASTWKRSGQLTHYYIALSR